MLEDFSQRQQYPKVNDGGEAVGGLVPPTPCRTGLNLFSLYVCACVFVCACVCVCVLACPSVPVEAPRGVFSGVIGVTGGCEMPGGGGTGN